MGKSFWLVVQYPMKSESGNQRDHWLKDKVIETLEVSLGDKNLGYVDGFDMGKRQSNPKTYALNIFCVVNEEEQVITLIKKVLRECRLDHTRIKIATMPYDSDKTDKNYTLKYSAKKGDTDFSL